jgi:hypothetical protein
MKFTFKSTHEFGTTVEINFDEEHIDEIEEMFKLFLRGSGFHIPDEDMYTNQENDNVSEECVHESDKKLWIGLSVDEVHEAAIKCVKTGQSVNTTIRLIEAQLKERNT